MSKVGIDCEMVQANDGKNMLARVSLVDTYGNKIYDSYVKPRKQVADYRFQVTGLTEAKLNGGKQFHQVQNDVKELIRGKTVVGHTVAKDLEVLELYHPTVVDIATQPKFMYGNEKRSLKDLTKQFLGYDIQTSYHDSVEDASAAIKLYTKFFN